MRCAGAVYRRKNPGAAQLPRPASTTQEAPPRRRCAGARCTSPRSVVRTRAVSDAGGTRPHVTNDGSPTRRPALEMDLPRCAIVSLPPVAAGTFSLVVADSALPASGSAPVQPSWCAAESATISFREWSAPASFDCCASWQGRGCASGFMAATVRRKQFPLRRAHSSRSKFFAPPGPPLPLRPQAVRPARPPPDGSQQGRDGRDLG